MTGNRPSFSLSFSDDWLAVLYGTEKARTVAMWKVEDLNKAMQIVDSQSEGSSAEASPSPDFSESVQEVDLGPCLAPDRPAAVSAS